MRSPTHSEGATVSTMHIFEGVAGMDIEVDGDTARIVDTVTGNEMTADLEPEELRLMAKAFTQAAQHLEAARR